MTDTSLLLKAYYEALYERLQADKELLITKVEQLLTKEIEKCGFEGFYKYKFAAYKEACLAFVDERIETYNPFGIQYTFDQTRSREAFELEMQIDWYDSRAEFENLVRAARSKAKQEKWKNDWDSWLGSSSKNLVPFRIRALYLLMKRNQA